MGFVQLQEELAAVKAHMVYLRTTTSAHLLVELKGTV
jgi:hypothetical protein